MAVPVSDAFAGSSLDPVWSPYDPTGLALSVNPPAVAGGLVTLAHTAAVNTNFLGATNRNAPRITQPIGDSEDFDVSCHFVRQPKGGAFLRQAIIIERVDRQQAVLFQFVVVAGGVNYRLQWGYLGSAGDVTWLSQNHGTNWNAVSGLNIRRVGDTYQAYYSNDSDPNVWIKFGSDQTLSTATFAPAYAGLMVARESGVAVDFQFLDFNSVGGVVNHSFALQSNNSESNLYSLAFSQNHQFAFSANTSQAHIASLSILQNHQFQLTATTSQAETLALVFKQNHQINLAVSTAQAYLYELALAEAENVEISLESSTSQAFLAELDFKQNHVFELEPSTSQAHLYALLIGGLVHRLADRDFTIHDAPNDYIMRDAPNDWLING